MVEIIETNWGIANYYPKSQQIEINKHLKDYRKLYLPILRHELGHDDTLFSWKELKYDIISDNKVSQWELIKFIIHHPKALTQFLPVSYSRTRGFVYDVNLLLLYLFLGTIIGLTVFLSLKYI